MSPRRAQPRSRDAGDTTGIEWVGGVLSMPAYVNDDGAPYRPEALFWLGADGAVLGSTLAAPGELMPMASESLRSTIEQPIHGAPHRPTRVRVASAELADALRAGHPGLDVVFAPTPEVDEMLALMREQMGEVDETEQSYLAPGIGPDAVASFFAAAAALFRTAPWKLVPDDGCLLSVTIEQLGVRDAAISVIGQMDQSLGFILFPGPEDYEDYLGAAEAIDRGEIPSMPPHFVLNFDRGADLAPQLRKEIAEHGWEVAGSDAYPWLVAIDEDFVGRPPTAAEVTMAEAIALALTRAMAEKRALLAAWDGGEPVSRTLSVTTHGGEIDVTLRVPCMRAAFEIGPSHDPVAGLAALVQDDDGIDEDARDMLQEALLQRFAASPEAKDLVDLEACRFVMDLAAEHLFETIATLGPSDLRVVMFELIPLKVSIDASAADWIVEEMRAFYDYLKREFGLEQADDCLRVLGDDAVRTLGEALADSSKFGMAKSLVMGAADAGVDMQTEDGIEAWMRSLQGGALAQSMPDPAAPKPSSRKAARARRDKRKAARKARKRNR